MTLEGLSEGSKGGGPAADEANVDPSVLDGAALRQIVVLGNDVVFVAGLDRRLTWVSPSVTRVLGWRPVELVGTEFSALLHPDDRAQTADVRQKVYEADPGAVALASEWAARVRRADGAYRWMSCQVSVITDDDGNPVAAASAWSDIDDLLRARELAEGGEPSHVTLFSFLDPRIRLQAVRDDGEEIVDFEFVDANAAACDALGLARAELLGTRLLESSPHLAGSDVLAAYVATVETGRAIEMRSTQIGPDESGGYFDLRGVRFGDGVTVNWRMVTGRVRREAALARLEERYLLMAENTSEVVVAGSNDGVIEWVSDSVSMLLGWTPDQLYGHTFADLVHPADRAAIGEVQNDVLAGREGSMTIRLAHAEDGWRWVSILVRPMLDGQGQVVGRIASWHDAEEEVNTREALEHYRRRFQLLADHTSDLVVRTTPDGLVRWISPSVEETLGWSAEATVGRALDELFHPDDRGAWSAGAPPDSQAPADPIFVRARHRDGDDRWMSLTSSVALDDGGATDDRVVALRDVDDLVRAQERARLEHERAEATSDTMLDPHMVVSAVRVADGSIIDFVCIEVNDTACEHIGFRREQILSQGLRSHLPPSTMDIVVKVLGEVIETGEPFAIEDLRYEDVRRRIRRIVDLRAVKLGDGASCTWRDNTERHRLEAAASARVGRDELTGLASRERVVERLTEALRSGAAAGRHVGVLMLDLDRFKLVNDSHGRAVGDEVLRAASQRLAALVRTGDLVGRMGGDEFVVVMADVGDPEELTSAARRLVSGFRVPLTVGGTQFSATVSVGIAVADEHSTAEDLLGRGDTAMYRAKDEGRDRASVYSTDLRDRAAEVLAIEGRLRPALANGEFELYYQPEIELGTGRVVAVEALIRWHHPSGETYSADRFVEIAEQSGAIVDIGEWVFGEACRQAAKWAERRPAGPVTVRINLAAAQLAEPTLPQVVDAAIAASGVDPSRLCVEITETALMRETDRVRENLTDLASRGIAVAIDDFGTGYASLAYLRDFPIDVIKIDRSFTALMVNDDYERRLIAGIIALAGMLDMRVTAEGIETEEQAQLLAGLGCNGGQGYLYSKAVPAAEVEGLFDRHFD